MTVHVTVHILYHIKVFQSTLRLESNIPHGIFANGVAVVIEVLALNIQGDGCPMQLIVEELSLKGVSCRFNQAIQIEG